MNKRGIKVILAKPRGFCAGVERAIDIVNKTLVKYGAPVYVRHEIVHNKYVVDDLKSRGVIFVDNLDKVPKGGITIFSAHGVSESVEEDAKNKGLPVLDATCPLVKKVHLEAARHDKNGMEIILIGHAGHPEVEGTSGRVKNKVILVQSKEDAESIVPKNPDNLAYVTQTTLSVDDTSEIISVLKKRFPNIQGPELKDICYATQNRQNAVRNIAKDVDVLLVIGAKNSSNSNRLRDLAEELGVRSYLINTALEISQEMFDKAEVIGITAGASAPEILLEDVLYRLKSMFNIFIEEQSGLDENVKFKLPKELL
jgi:4-hydroxy-3-methylbut-2-enyl diphosphate reductase